MIGSRPDGWWRDRPKARRELVAQLAPIAQAGEPVTVVFDGRAKPDELELAGKAGIRSVFAPGGPDAADHMIVKILHETVDIDEVTVVTSDATLAENVRQLGAKVQTAGSFRGRLGG